MTYPCSSTGRLRTEMGRSTKNGWVSAEREKEATNVRPLGLTREHIIVPELMRQPTGLPRV